MKKIVIILAAITFLVINTIVAQAPQAFKYQTVARDNTGNILASKNVSFRISLLQGSIFGTNVYSETQTATTNQFGLANLNIGQGTVVSGTFSTINWGNNSYFVKIEFDPAGGSNYVLMGTSQLLSVPYALYAEKTNGADLNYPDGINGTVISIASSAGSYTVPTNQTLYLSSAFGILTIGSDTLISRGVIPFPSGTVFSKQTGSGSFALTGILVPSSTNIVLWHSSSGSYIVPANSTLFLCGDNNWPILINGSSIGLVSNYPTPIPAGSVLSWSRYLGQPLNPVFSGYLK